MDTKEDQISQEDLNKVIYQLERQRAEHDETKEAARYLELTNDELQKRAETLEEELEKQRQKFENERQRYSDGIGSHALQCEELRHEISNKQSEISVLEHFLHQRNEEYEHISQEFHDYKESEDVRLAHIHTNVDQAVEKHESEKSQFIENHESNQSVITSLALQNDNLNQDVQHLTEHIHDLDREIEGLRHMTSDNEHEISTLSAQLNDKHDYIRKLESREESPHPFFRVGNMSFADASMNLLTSFMQMPLRQPPAEQYDTTDDEEEYVVIDDPVKVPVVQTDPSPIATSIGWWKFLLVFVLALSGGFVLGYTYRGGFPKL